MSVLMSYHQTFIEAVRTTGGNNSSRILVIQGPSTDIEKTKSLMTTFPSDSLDDYLMAEIHYYTPWNFCGLEKDEWWGKMFYFWGKDYHSTTNTERNATWGEESTAESLLKSMKTKFVDKGIPIILGEYGAIKRTSLSSEDLDLHIASREYYFKYITNAAKRNGMIPIYWDNGYSGVNSSAIFNRYNGAVLDSGALKSIRDGMESATSVEEPMNQNIKSEVDYINALPNPFSSSTDIQFYVEKNDNVNIYIFNILGQLVDRFTDLNFSQGIRSVKWQPKQLSNGAYFININVGKKILTKKILLVD